MSEPEAVTPLVLRCEHCEPPACAEAEGWEEAAAEGAGVASAGGQNWVSSLEDKVPASASTPVTTV